MGEALKNRATGLIEALLDPVATIEGYVNLLRAIPQLPELVDQYVAEFLYDLDDEERAEQLGKLLTEAVLVVVPRPNIPNLSGITKKLGKAGAKTAAKAAEQGISSSKYFKKPPGELTKLKGNQGWKDRNGNIWKKDMKHRDHWDVIDPRTGKKIKEVDFNGNQLWPAGPKNKNKK